MSFVHLHLHSEYSLLDGACRIKELVQAVKAFGQDAAAVTDHGNMFAAGEFYSEAVKAGIKPIIGCEVYVAKRTRFDRLPDLDSKPYHLILLCENNTGYHNLMKLVSASWTEGFYYKPRVDCDLLEQYHEGLIALSACLAGEIPTLLKNREIEAAFERAKYYKKLFGENNFFLEIQDHGIEEQKQVNRSLVNMSKELSIPLVATNDCHYVRKEDAEIQDILLCIQTGSTKNDPNRMKFETDEFYIKTEQEMRSLFPELPEAIENTQLIADRCCVTIEKTPETLPTYNAPNGEDHLSYLRRICYAGMKKRYGESVGQNIIDRLEYELDVISKTGFVDYYLIVFDYVRYAKRKGIPVGPGRGSGAASLAAYCIGITDIDPIRYDLIFERFLNPERVKMPDFDVDFCQRRRYEVIEYLKNKYGSDHVAQIIAFGTLGARAAVRDVGRVLGEPLYNINRISKLIPRRYDITLEAAIAGSAELSELYKNDDSVRRLLGYALRVEGMPRNTTIHAAGVVITRDTVDSYVPLAMNDDTVVTQYTMSELEELGLVKMDLLVLRNVTVLDDAKQLVLHADPNFSEKNINYEDSGVFNMLSKGHTEGVFQFESPGVRDVLMKLKPTRIDDLIAIMSLYRPGPMDSIPRYIENKHDPRKITYKHPKLEPILRGTYGCIVYQEQVMEIFRELAGYSYGRADNIRRSMSKKKKDDLERERRIFIYGLTHDDGMIEVEGCIRRGISESIASVLFDEMLSFASYAFNKAHAAAYSTVSYMTAWYKYYYPREYMAALLTSVLESQGSLVRYMNECKRLGIRVLPPHVNYSGRGFTVHENHVYFGLMAIKNIGSQLVESIIKERESRGAYTTFASFCTRLAGGALNMPGVTSLIKAGALDGLGSNRRQLLLTCKQIVDQAELEKKRNLDGQLSLFGDDVSRTSYEYEIPEMPDLTIPEKLMMEKEVAGVYLSGNPLLEYEPFINSVPHDSIADIISDPERYLDRELRLIALIGEVKKVTTKKGKMMAFAKLEDLTAGVELIVFPDQLDKFGDLIYEGSAVELYAKLSLNEDEVKLIAASFVKAQKEAVSDYSRNGAASINNAESGAVRLFLKFSSKSSKQYEYAKRLLAVFDGGCPVSLFIEDNPNGEKYEHLPAENNVQLNDVLINELKRVLGGEAVVVKKVRSRHG